MGTWQRPSCSWENETLIESRTGTWICCSGTGFGNESGSCCGIGCVFCVSDWGKSFCFGVHGRHASWSALLAALHHRRRRRSRGGNPGVFRTGPSGPAAPAHRGARRPWRPSRPRRPFCRGSAQTRIRGSPSCSGPGGCTRPRPGRTSRTRVSGSRARFGTLSCPL